MPTDKPYQVSVRLKVHDKPTRRVPLTGTETATDCAIAILIDGDDRECEDVRVVEALQDLGEESRYRRLLAAWIGLGDYFAKTIATSCRTEKTQADRLFALLAKVIDNMVSEVIQYAKNPEDMVRSLLLTEMATQVLNQLEQQNAELPTEPSKKFGTN